MNTCIIRGNYYPTNSGVLKLYRYGLSFRFARNYYPTNSGVLKLEHCIVFYSLTKLLPHKQWGSETEAGAV